jgi:hypothetical protein
MWKLPVLKGDFDIDGYYVSMKMKEIVKETRI